MKLNSILSLLIIAALGATLSSCTVSLEDRTTDSAYNSPINEKTFFAEVSTQGTRVCGVDLSLDGGASLPMTNSNGNQWQLVIPVAPCQEVVEYHYTVSFSTNEEGSSCPSSKRFPESGAFRKTITSQPEACNDHHGSVARVFTVNTFDDLPDDNPGDGKCQTSGPGSPCALRAAIMEANAKPGSDLIKVPQGRYTLTQAKPIGTESDDQPEDAYGDLDVTDDLTIEGLVPDQVQIGDFLHGFRPNDLTTFDWRDYEDDPERDDFFVKIDANEIDRVMQIHHGGGSEPIFVELKKLQLMNGRAAERPGGGILNNAILNMEKVVVIHNTLINSSDIAGVFSSNRGAGISNNGILSMRDGAIMYNAVNFRSGIGGGLYNNFNSDCKLEAVLMSNNSARFGAAVYNNKGDKAKQRAPGNLRMTNCTVSRNEPTGSLRSIVTNDGTAQLFYVSIVAHTGHDALLTTADGRTWMAHCLLSEPVDCRGEIISYGGNWISSYGNGCQFAAVSDSLNRYVDASAMRYKGGFTPVHPFSTFDNRFMDKAPPVIVEAKDQTGSPRFVDGDNDGKAWPDPGAWEAPANN